MQTLTTQTISTPGTEMRVWRTPALDRKCIVFLHGAGVDHRMFDDQVAELAGAYSLVLPDLRGQGLSILKKGHRATLDTVIDDVKVMLDSLGIDRASIVGHSFGGNIAQEFTHRHADRVDKLVMIGSPGQHREMSGAAASAIKIGTHLYRRIPWGPFAFYSGRWSSRNPATRRYVADCMLAAGRQTWLDLGTSGFASLCPVDTAPRKETLLMRGEVDMPRQLDRIYDALSDQLPDLTRRVVITGVGHQCTQDNPEEVNRAPVEFLAD